MGVRDARRPSATDKMSVVPVSSQDGGSPYGRDGRDEGELKDRLFIRGTFSLNYAIMCHG